MQVEESAREEVWVDALGDPISHFAHAVRFGDLLFISGCAPTDADQNLVGGDDAASQARQVLVNISPRILETAGMDFGDILKVTVFLTDINDRAKINPVRKEFFGAARPASTLVEVGKLAIRACALRLTPFRPPGGRPPERATAELRSACAP